MSFLTSADQPGATYVWTLASKSASSLSFSLSHSLGPPQEVVTSPGPGAVSQWAPKPGSASTEPGRSGPCIGRVRESVWQTSAKLGRCGPKFGPSDFDQHRHNDRSFVCLPWAPGEGARAGRMRGRRSNAPPVGGAGGRAGGKLGAGFCVLVSAAAMSTANDARMLEKAVALAWLY